MENTTAEESMEIKTTSTGTDTKRTAKKPALKTKNAPKVKIGTIEEETAKETTSMNKKTNEEKNGAEEAGVISEQINTSKKTNKKQTSKKKYAAKKPAKNINNKDLESFLDENSNPGIMIIVEENPSEMIFNALVESGSVLPNSKKKNKKEKKADKKKEAKRRTLCKLVKNDFLKKNISEYKDLAVNPEWICRKCGRVANDPKSLCKPTRLSKNESGDILI